MCTHMELGPVPPPEQGAVDERVNGIVLRNETETQENADATCGAEAASGAKDATESEAESGAEKSLVRDELCTKTLVDFDLAKCNATRSLLCSTESDDDFVFLEVSETEDSYSDHYSCADQLSTCSYPESEKSAKLHDEQDITACRQDHTTRPNSRTRSISSRSSSSSSPQSPISSSRKQPTGPTKSRSSMLNYMYSLWGKSAASSSMAGTKKRQQQQHQQKLVRNIGSSSSSTAGSPRSVSTFASANNFSMRDSMMTDTDEFISDFDECDGISTCSTEVQSDFGSVDGHSSNFQKGLGSTNSLHTMTSSTATVSTSMSNSMLVSAAGDEEFDSELASLNDSDDNLTVTSNTSRSTTPAKSPLKGGSPLPPRPPPTRSSKGSKRLASFFSSLSLMNQYQASAPLPPVAGKKKDMPTYPSQMSCINKMPSVRKIPVGRTECNRVLKQWLVDLKPEKGTEWLKTLQQESNQGVVAVEVQVFGKLKVEKGSNGTEPLVNIMSANSSSDTNANISADANVDVNLEAGADSKYAEQIWDHQQRSDDEIKRDVSRTYSTVPRFNETETRERLGRLLRWVADTWPDVGYVQGMNYVCAQVQLHSVDEAQAHQLLGHMFNKSHINLRGIYSDGLVMLQAFVQIFAALLKEKCPNVYGALCKLGMDSLHFCYNWFLTLFAYTMPFETLIKVWDLFFHQGWEAIFRISIVLVSTLEVEEGQDWTLESVTNALRSAPIFPPYDLIERAGEIHFTQEQLHEITSACRTQFPPV